jgi:hypothetical protein
MVGVLKKQMQRSLETKRYSHEEICKLLHEAQLKSSRAAHLLETGVRIYIPCVQLI